MDTSHTLQKKSLPKKSPEEWRKIWLKKSVRALWNDGDSVKDKDKAVEAIKTFLGKFSGSPYYYSPEKVEEYVIENRYAPLPSLQFFYEKVARSKRHLTLLHSLAERNPASEGTLSGSGRTDALLDNIEEHCIGRNIPLSEREEIGKITAGFLRFYKKHPSEIPLHKIESSLLKRYNTGSNSYRYLREGLKALYTIIKNKYPEQSQIRLECIDNFHKARIDSI